MTILLEFLNEHALSIDFGMFLLIWLVQVIIYPAFRQINETNFIIYHRSYCNAIGFFVIPVMACQLIGTSAACFFSIDNLIWVKMLAVIGAWVVTFLTSAPCHRQLQAGKNAAVIERLIRTNWWRTFLWSLVFLVSLVSYYQ